MATTRATPASVVALRFDGGALWAIDQTELPWRERELELRSAEDVAAAIRRLAIRGAPLIGVAGAYGVALELARDPSAEALDRARHILREARPTAVNLSAAVDRVHEAASAAGADRRAAALSEARAIEAEEETASAAIANHGADLLAGARRILTHCNTGALAAPGRGTALAVIAELAARGTLEHVLATESRPLLQGARLTAYELARLNISHELIVDSAAAGLIAGGAVDAVIVGCDRVAANGDVANKVGTYGLALAARAASIPFVVAGPTSTIDRGTPTGTDIRIEERDADEVRLLAGQRVTLDETRCRNPAFDVTPAALVTALVTERGVTRSPGSAPLTT
ncbi:MAG TPA: S-methyl-5-thioribose-1-phosphate isomerase [Solirubrobacteraceae bacterium]|jgi:methylthioribose-1-phosphate isomerase|nr:S-methyl-5-thioribose-1-phosphate isomerase [Solirubrobacteraceae bacterium]